MKKRPSPKKKVTESNKPTLEKSEERKKILSRRARVKKTATSQNNGGPREYQKTQGQGETWAFIKEGSGSNSKQEGKKREAKVVTNRSIAKKGPQRLVKERFAEKDAPERKVGRKILRRHPWKN